MDLRELKSLWKKKGFRPRKRLGQNFLVDKNVRDNIVNALPLDSGLTVIEIGVGFGVMTFPIASRCARLFAVEKDKDICGIMGPVFDEKENITLVRSDILELDFCGLAGGREDVLVYGNIPYYISTPVIEKIITSSRCVRTAYLVMQEELADRIASRPGPKSYGSVSCFVQYYAEPRKVFKISRNSFYPRPQVDSCLLELKIREKPAVEVKDEKLLFKVIRKAFSQRRKKALNSLSHGDFLSIEKGTWHDIFDRCGIDLCSRAEDLSLPDYARVADEVYQYNTASG